MPQDVVDISDVSRDQLIAGETHHAESPDSLLVEARGELMNLMILLGSASANFSLALERYRRAGRRNAQIDTAITNLKNFAQLIVDDAENMLGPDVARSPRHPDAPVIAGADIGAGKPEGRVRSSKTVDFAILEALYLRPSVSNPISQKDLEDIARALEPATHHGSFVSKLNRWKNLYKLVIWESPEDISLTVAGSAKRGALLPLARKEGRLQVVADAISAVTGARAQY